MNYKNEVKYDILYILKGKESGGGNLSQKTPLGIIGACPQNNQNETNCSNHTENRM